ncbi:MAG: methylenetetrahydrofolate reductase [Hyphomicrobiaceae bacterium]
MEAFADTPANAPKNDNMLNRIASDLVLSWSVEMGAHDCSGVHAIADVLPRGAAVYINHLQSHTLDNSLHAARMAHDAGLEPVVHVAARRVETRADFDRFLEGAQRIGIHKLLLLGGDRRTPVGPFADAASLLRNRCLADFGIREVGFAGYPEGHPRIQSGLMVAALDEKLELAERQGLGAYVVTQFCFAPSRIIHFCNDLQRRAPRVAVYVGVAGPISPVKLLGFAQRCGVGASLRALKAQRTGALRVFTHRDPGKLLASIAPYLRMPHRTNVVGVHVFSFGHVAQSAHWIKAIVQNG